jgi:hypothetical protein
MRKIISISVIFSIHLICCAQNFRDRFLGTYTCNFEEYHFPGIYYGVDELYITAAGDTNNIIVSDSASLLNYEYIAHYDSSFEDIWEPNIKYGHFYLPDSMYLFDLYNSPRYREFHGARLGASIGNNTKFGFQLFPIPANVRMISIVSSVLFNQLTSLSLHHLHF